LSLERQMAWAQCWPWPAPLTCRAGDESAGSAGSIWPTLPGWRQLWQIANSPTGMLRQATPVLLLVMHTCALTQLHKRREQRAGGSPSQREKNWT
jgi:hypothetical protein